MNSHALTSAAEKTLAIIMGGGAGTRLFPLTKDRAKPAVPLAGKYRLVDIPISNCINSDLGHIYILTQFMSASLHRHINSSYKFDRFSRRFVEIRAAQQTPSGAQWYQGTADAVRQNLKDFLNWPYEYFLILSGDQLYRMDYREMIARHVQKKADISIATLPVARDLASSFGIMHSDADGRITRFEEKPKDTVLLDQLRMPEATLKEMGHAETEELYEASMGIYIFNRKTLIESLDNDLFDFGKHIIPDAIKKCRVQNYVFEGYWEDIGTIRAFFDANLALTNPVPPFNFFDTSAPIYTHARFLPATKINGATVRQAIISDGCIISDAHIERAVIGVRSYINSGTTIRHSVVMGADFYEADLAAKTNDGVELGIGKNCVIDHAIIDKNARIGDGVVITSEGKPDHLDCENYFIRDGIVIVPKGATIPPGTWI